MVGDLTFTGTIAAATVAEAAAGDADALARIVGAHHDDMARIAFVICGDQDLAQEALWDPVTGRFSPASLLAGKRSQPIGVPMRDGRVPIVGGDTDPAASSATYSTAEVYDPATGAFAAAGPIVGKG